MTKVRGFTLIELIIVIVILGILAVTAAPRFFDFSTSARESTLSGLRGAIQGAIQIEYARSALDGTPVYPDGAGLVDALQLGDGDWRIAIDGDVARFQPANLPAAGFQADDPDTITECYVNYDASSADADTPPDITVITAGC